MLDKFFTGKSLQYRISAILALVTIVVMLGYAAFDFLTTRANMQGELYRNAEIAAERMSNTLANPMWNFEMSEVNDLILSEMMDQNIYSVVVHEDSNEEVYVQYSRNANWEIQESSGDITENLIHFNKEIVLNEQVLGSVDVYFTTRFMQEALRTASITTAATVVILIIALLLAVHLTIHVQVIKPVNRISAGLNDISDYISDASQTLSSDSKKMADLTAKQASSMEESSGSLEEMSARIRDNASNAQKVNELARESEGAIGEGNQRMTEMQNVINDLSNSSSETSKIVKTINEIAFQTNLLSLNASVEAARAGEAGRGFSVVAEEIRNLSNKVADAANETARLIDGSLTQTERSVEIVSYVAGAFQQIGSSVKEMNMLAEKVSIASAEQSQGMDQIKSGISWIDQATQNNVHTADQTAMAAQDLSDMSNKMRAAVKDLLSLTGASDGSHQKKNGQQRKGVQQKKSDKKGAQAQQKKQKPENQKKSQNKAENSDEWLNELNL